MAEIRMRKLHVWFASNKLSLNFSKSNFIIFHGKNKNVYGDIDKIYFGNECIHRVRSTKYIGLVLDETLSWKEHTQNILNSLYRYFGVFYNLRKFLNTRLIRMAYFSCIFSRLKFGIEVAMYNTTLVHQLQVVQNKLLRV